MFGLNLMVVASFTVVSGIIVKDPPLASSEYKYSYDIEDPTTGDTKSLQESRLGGTVKGSYSVIDPDGTRRTVEYTADAVHGFNAIVHKEPLANKGNLQNDIHHSYFDYPYEYQNAEQNERNIYEAQQHNAAVQQQHFFPSSDISMRKSFYGHYFVPEP